MQAAVSSVKFGLKLNPSFAKNALLRLRSATGMLTNSMRPGWAGMVMAAGLLVVARRVRPGRRVRPAELIGGDRSVRTRRAPSSADDDPLAVDQSFLAGRVR